MDEANGDQIEAQDDLLDDLMNIVQNETSQCLKTSLSVEVNYQSMS